MVTNRPKLPGLVQQYVTQGDRGLREWHLLLRRVTFGAALVLMAASIVSLHWACSLIGLPDKPYAPIAWIVPLAMEVGTAAVASTATTIRKPTAPGDDSAGRYYLSLWLIFSFIMALAQAANIGHAAVVVSDRIGELPAFFPQQVVYGFACTFAALFPLGGTLLVHVSGFLRVHGTGARWIDDDSELVMVQATPGAPPARPARAPQPRTAPAAPPVRAQEPAAASAPEPRVDDEGARVSKMARARALFDEMVAETPDVKPPANVIQREAGLEQGQDGGMHPGHFRKYVNGWYADFTTAREAARQQDDPTREPEQLRAVAGDYPRTLSEAPVTLERAHERTGT